MISQSKFYRDLIIVVIISIAIAWIVANYALNSPVPVSFWLACAFITGATVTIHRVLLNANKKRPALFVTYFMGALTAKLFLSAMLLVVIGLLDKPGLKFTAVGFFILYILLTAVELFHLLPLLRNSNH